MTPNAVYSRFFREVFLAELMATDPVWVLKGGTNLYCLIPGARHTQDLDLYRQASPTGHRAAADSLIAAMDQTTIGPYTFYVRNPRRETASGTVENIQLTVIVRFGTTEFSRFNIDVSGDLEAPTVTEPLAVTRADPLEVPFARRHFTVLSYPIENQLADKTCAMYEIHGTRSSTRYRDLYDIALIALELEVDAGKLRTALGQQSRIRTLALPPRLILPSDEWPAGYQKFVGTLHRPRPELRAVDSALTTAEALLNSVLSPDNPITAGCWSPERRKWQPRPVPPA
ncbi:MULTISPECIES: nucleotidyl transferase AbiEii/AbiGii toxin family protein [unclassified Dietzia]|uniref:nucleotidyl transferase AbiEii/AbiGii toxin family protein n=1 Tax=unclassified Dietzia TaxID=2617939 RepID=UPI0015FB7E89|nr:MULTISPECIES: nucleotidyl transferase AbiEii/AbiGii toxin family protein [unclassified Dietzia]MBB1050660.1 nucleotidyl transferase AbiEii/AbiGii toxin family protein [Dietzia sp. CW19]MBB1054423.1 nucleotidyl transferase AbiEii/AbiGii toxin family protein [Dietzia sp. B44]MBC7295503.1 nucleotidyl transferase AbiEii/AbiGii toxin family protein [Dietzia sp.]